MPLKTLFLNPPSFENFDGGAGSRWPATREIESYWYPVWLAYPTGMLEGARLLDAPPHHITAEETIRTCKDYELLVLFTSTPGFAGDVRIAEAIKDSNPHIKIAFVGPHVSVLPEKSLMEAKVIDVACRKEFDYSIVEYAQGKPIEDILGISYRKNGGVMHNPDRPTIQDLDSLPHVTDVYRRDLDVRRYNVPFLLHPFVSLYTTRGCPAQCTFCLWPQTLSGHPWRKRSTDDVAREMAKAKEYWPYVKEFFFDDDTFNLQKARTVELCAKLKPLGLTWSCTSRVTTDFETLKAMKEAGCRLLIVGYESGDQQILKNIKKGATIERARQFTKDCHKLGLVVHGDFIIGLPGESRETIKNGFMTNDTKMVDDGGHQMVQIEYPGLPAAELLEAVHHFYDEYYFRPKAAYRILRKAMFDNSERKRLYKEARTFLKLRAQRHKWVKENRKEETPTPEPAKA